ncbi:MAG TPA: restriction endonuclease subunit S, partial [Salinimicrobium sp.]|nr:restriction endonuclease subunit S [Salinimicrobium sp.]
FESPINTSNYLSSIIQKGAKNTINITNKTFLSKKIILPISKREQQKIASTLSAIDKKIDLEIKLLNALMEQKKYFLQNLFI